MKSPSINKIFSISSKTEFDILALETFHYQSENNLIYAAFLEGLRTKKSNINKIEDIPFLPIDFFKHHIVNTEPSNFEIIFSSSGTTSTLESKHYVNDINWYKESYLKGFEKFYGSVSEYCILALLPNYLEREGSSLIYMVNDLIKKSNHPESGFFLYNTQTLCNLLEKLKSQKQKTILFGVTYALLDFIESFNIDFADLIVIETGGMKGKRKEIIREELHNKLQAGFGVKYIHSEYGMTELLSQAYSKQNGVFNCPSWMKIIIRDTNDPLTFIGNNKIGGINVIDLANQHSCSFIATQDLGKTFYDETFEVLGRFDFSDIRGCNLMVG